MKKSYFLLVFLLHSICNGAFGQFVNNGTLLSIGKNTMLYVDQSYVHNFGTILNNGEMVVTGNWTNTNVNSRVFDITSAGTNIFTNTLLQLGGSGSTQFPELIFARNGTVSLSRNIEARILLDLGDKEVVTGSYSLTLSNADPASLTRTGGFINTDGGGVFSRATNSNSSYLFPLGSNTAGIFRPVNVTPKDNQSNTYDISLINKDATNDGYSRLSKRAEVAEINDRYYYKLAQSVGVSNTDFTFFTHTREGDYNGITSWVGGRIWEKAGLVNVQDGSYFNGALNKSLTYSLLNSNTVGIQVPLINVPFSLAKVADVNNPLVIFNAFSPDGDGKNDRWEIKNIAGFPDNDLKIYDRSGNLIFKMAGYNDAVAWDGHNTSSGTYFYVLRVKINSEDKYYKGAITLIKK